MHIGLIGYSEKMKWPQHYTLNGDTNIEGEVKNMKFDEKKPTITLQVTVLFLGTENDHDHVTIARSKSSLSFRSCTNSLMLIKKKEKKKERVVNTADATKPIMSRSVESSITLPIDVTRIFLHVVR